MSSDNWRESLHYLEDYDLKIFTKDGKKEARLIPPKIKGKHYTNMEFLVNAELIWLTPTRNPPSPSYDERSDNSFFEQCFRPCAKLGEGSFCSVIKVKSVDDGKFYAVKISKEPFRNEFDRKQKLKEVEHHQALSHHPNIVTLHKAWEEDRYLFMQMELCKQSVKEGIPLSERLCWNVLADILQALDFIHTSGRGHFDVKVENILLGEDTLYKLGDFGLMLHFGQEEEIRKEGDAKYVAPELILGGMDEFTPKADIFSLGISVLELAGNLELPNYGDVWNALRQNKFPLAQTKHLSDDLLKLLMRMMAYEADDRPTAREILELPKMKAVVKERKMLQVSQVMAVINNPWIENDVSFLLACAWVYSYTLVTLVAKLMTQLSNQRMDCDSTSENNAAESSSDDIPNTGIKTVESETTNDDSGASSSTDTAFSGGSERQQSPVDDSALGDEAVAAASGAAPNGASPNGQEPMHASTPKSSREGIKTMESETTNDDSGASSSTDTAFSGGSEWQQSPVDDSALGGEAVAAASGAAPNGQEPMHARTPKSSREDVFDSNDCALVKRVKLMRRERSESLNSDGMEYLDWSAPSSRDESPCPPPQIYCDWVSLTSPDRNLREQSINRNRLHCPTESLLQFGISPLRLSEAVKRDYKEQKFRRRIVPRNLAHIFGEEEEEEEDKKEEEL